MNHTKNSDVDEMLNNAKQASSFLKALSNEKRLIILCHLLDEEHTVGSINEKLPLSQSALSQHLAVLRKDGLVKTRRDSQSIYYSIADGKTVAFIRTLHDLFCSPKS
ncbi:metalloregulator ArsR/SmtB family transcription factor [Marinomonas sp. 15G1-11]|uniref:Metalloregulator ArsR/SmtB family transcription factor n=1 Tax=Marinomonas phaeophyticola TaxID=3004091 RepID=A0ABT4JYX8_9GAMM|nr:metalloregulator ArsR/SmtB family transcription factor [Marinomonas sp. 15G1-11]MCZ2723431.1 metalloregulator ArsR/SmtB family transcription factor [Marinomonas sp. 15G1-11]